MLNIKSLIFTIFIVLSICNFTYGEDDCEIQTNNSKINLTGKWQYIASVTENPEEVRCGQIFLRKVSSHVFRGVIFSFHGLQKKNVTIRACIVGNSFGLRFRRVKGYGPLLPMSVVSCDVDNEFALELPSRKMYFIFSKNDTVSPKFHYRYEKLAMENGLILQTMNNTNCE